MRVLGLDVGSKTIGVAVSDPLGIMAQGITVIRRGKLKNDLAELQKLIRDYDASAIVVGLPLSLKGEEGHQAAHIRDFMAELEKVTNLPLITIDERFSTSIAQRALMDSGMGPAKRKQIIDQQAAQLILQTYLERERNRRLADEAEHHA